MPDEECYRRITDVHGLETRVRLLEEARLHLMEGHNHHEVVIEKLENDSREMVVAVKLMAQGFLDFKNQFKTGFQIICFFAAVITTSIGAFWAYSHDLDNKYQAKMDKLVVNTETQKQTTLANSAKLNDIKTVASQAMNSAADQRDAIQSQFDNLDDLQVQLNKLKKLKVIKGSK